MKHGRLIDADEITAFLRLERNGKEVESLDEFPTIEPDIPTCEDCKYADEKPISDGRYWCSIHGSFMYYCSDAERRGK